MHSANKTEIASIDLDIFLIITLHPRKTFIWKSQREG